MSVKPRVKAPDSNSGNLIQDSALGLVPETLPHYLELTVAIWDLGPLPPADIELARLRNAAYVGCVMCQAVRYDVAVEDGLKESDIDSMRSDAKAGLSARQQVIIDFVDHYLHTPGPIDTALQAALDAHLSADEQSHLALLMAYFNGFSRCAVALGGMPESMPRMEISVPR